MHEEKIGDACCRRVSEVSLEIIGTIVTRMSSA